MAPSECGAVFKGVYLRSQIFDYRFMTKSLDPSRARAAAIFESPGCGHFRHGGAARLGGRHARPRRHHLPRRYGGTAALFRSSRASAPRHLGDQKAYRPARVHHTRVSAERPGDFVRRAAGGIPRSIARSTQLRGRRQALAVGKRVVNPNGALSLRALILAPSGRDAPLLVMLLQEAGFAADICMHLGILNQELHKGAGLAIIADEALQNAELR